jgi:hypothetical protein
VRLCFGRAFFLAFLLTPPPPYTHTPPLTGFSCLPFQHKRSRRKLVKPFCRLFFAVFPSSTSDLKDYQLGFCNDCFSLSSLPAQAISAKTCQGQTQGIGGGGGGREEGKKEEEDRTFFLPALLPSAIKRLATAS